MKIESASIIPSDGFVAINGEGYSGCEIAVDPHDRYGPVHAIQWWGDHGQSEHARGPGIGFTDVALVEQFVPAWLARRAEVLRAVATHIETQHKHAANNLEGHVAAAADVDKQLDSPEITEAARARLLRVKDDVAKRIEHFKTLHATLTEHLASANEKATQAETEVEA